MTSMDRLHAVLVKTGAATVEELQSGKWSEELCPYVITRTPEGGFRITINKGDALSRGSGATFAEAVAMLETKAGIEPPVGG